MALSRDGTMLVFVSPEEKSALPMLFVQRIGSPSVMLLQGTQNASYPFWSPDGTHVAFFANGKLQKIAIAGGTPQSLANTLSARGGAWGSRDVIVYAPDAGSGLWRINADGTGSAPLMHGRNDEEKRVSTMRWPVFLDDGSTFLFWAGNFGDIKNDQISGIYVASLDAKEKKLVTLCHSNFGFDSHNLYYADDQRQLVSVPFDASSGKVAGRTTVLANNVGFQPSTYWAALAVGSNGTVIYNTGVGAALSVLTWMDRSGKVLGKIGEASVVANPTLSPEDSRVAVDITDLKTNNVDVWLLSTRGTGNARFTFDPVEEVAGVWSRDGSKVAYRSIFSSGTTIFSKRANGLEPEKPLVQGQTLDDIIPNSWSADGQQLLCTTQSATRWSLALLPSTGGRPKPFLPDSKANESNGQISPDGKWVAYASDESGSWEIYVTSFPGVVGKWQVSRGGGTEPRWRGDSKEIYYIGSNGMLMAVPVNSDAGFTTATPMPMFQIQGRAPISSTDVFTYDVAKDGQRFLVNHYVSPEHIPPLTILLNTPAAN